MNWNSYGLIFKSNKIKWIKSHAWVPTVFKFNRDKAKIFFAGRDNENHSNIGSFDVDLRNPSKILDVTDKPILKKGRLGCFDDCAVIPSQIIKFKKKFYMFYTGWTQGRKLPYLSSIGLALSDKLSGNFKRVSEAPIFGRTKDDPIFVASCFVEKINKKFGMYYTTNTNWRVKNKKFYPKYFLKYAESKDLINWKFKKNIMKFKSTKEVAVSRPWIVKFKNKKIIFYSHRGIKYKIGYAVINKNNFLERKDDLINITNNKDKFDNEMQEYASIVQHKKKLFMFYNGNNFGEKGIGLAELKL